MMERADLQTKMRTGLRRLAKAVVVITTEWNGRRYAMAATAVSEVSMDPPSLLVCVNRQASLHEALASGAAFCVNILHSSHRDVSAACGGALQGEARFGVGEWINTDHGAARLKDAQAAFLCTNEQRTDFGSHSIFIGQVVEIVVEGDVDPLVYVDGGYHQVGDAINA